MNEHKAVPNIRFNSFEDKWKDTKLKKLAPLRGGHAFSSIKFRRKGIPIIRITNILENGKTGGNFVYYSEAENDVSYTLRKGDCILAMSGATIGKSAVVKEEYNKYYQNQRVGMFQQNSQYYYRFVIILVKSNLFSRQLSRVFVQGAQPNISSKEIDSFNFYVPNKYTEQQKIGDFFTKLDKLLDLQQQKIDKLELLKKALLQTLFPRHDAQIPEFRFKGFEEDWKKTRIEKIVQYSNSTYSVKDLKQKKEKKFYSVYDATGRQYYSNSFDMDKKYIAIIKDGSNVGAVKLLPARTSVLSTMGYLGAHNSDIAFDYYVFKKLNFKKYKVGSGIPHIYFSDYKKQVELVPQLSEQQKIGNLLSKVDQLIELENKKLQNFQQVKKCLLQNMFVE